MHKNKLYYIVTGILLACPIILLALILLSPNVPIYDERNFVKNIPLLQFGGFSESFLNGLKNQSPGPLYQYIYYPLTVIGLKSIVLYRIINTLFLICIVFFTYKTITNQSKSNALIAALLIFAVPITWVTGGLALTEAPSLAFVMAGVYTLYLAIFTKKYNNVLFSLAGLLFGFAVSGRTPFLMVLPATAYLFFKLFSNIDKPGIILFYLFALTLPLYIFYTWKGLVPPDVQKIQSGINFLYFGDALSYMFVFMLIINPQWLKMPAKYYFIAVLIFIVLLILNIGIFHISFMPMQSFERILPFGNTTFAITYLPLIMQCVMLSFSFMFMVSLVVQFKSFSKDYWQVFLLLSALFILCTTVKSAAQFSTRYPFQAIPFMLLLCYKNLKVDVWMFLRIIIGIVLGIISMEGQYKLYKFYLNI